MGRFQVVQESPFSRAKVFDFATQAVYSHLVQSELGLHKSLELHRIFFSPRFLPAITLTLLAPMTITFICDNCQSTVSTPDAMAGKKGKCPSCGNIVKIPQPNPLQNSAAPAKPGAPVPQLPGSLQPLAPLPPVQPFGLSDLTSNNPLDDLSGFNASMSVGGSLPPATPTSTYAPNSGYSSNPNARDPFRRYQAEAESSDVSTWPILLPGGILIAGNVLALLICFLQTVFTLNFIHAMEVGGVRGGMRTPTEAYTMMIGYLLVNIVLTGLGVFGAICMVRRETYAMAVTGAVFSMISPICILGIIGIILVPFGIWGLFVLCIPNYKRQFSS